MAYPFRQKVPSHFIIGEYLENDAEPTLVIVDGKRTFITKQHTMITISHNYLSPKFYDYNQDMIKHGAIWKERMKIWSCYPHEFQKMFLPLLPANICCRDVIIDKDGCFKCTIGEKGCKRRIDMDLKIIAAKELLDKRLSQYKVTAKYENYCAGAGTDIWTDEKYFDNLEDATKFIAEYPPIGKVIRNKRGVTNTTISIDLTEPSHKNTNVV